MCKYALYESLSYSFVDKWYHDKDSDHEKTGQDLVPEAEIMTLVFYSDTSSNNATLSQNITHFKGI